MNRFFGAVLGCVWACAAMAGGSSGPSSDSPVSVTSANSCIAISPSPGTGRFTVGGVAPNRKVAAPTIASTDMCGQVIVTSGAITIPAIGAGVFPIGSTLSLVNYINGTATVTSTPTINTGGGCVQASGIPAGDTWQLSADADGTTLDCFQTVSAAGSGIVNSGTINHPAYYAANGTAVSTEIPVTDTGSSWQVAEAALTTPVALTDGATIATNAALSNVFTVTIAGNRTLSNPTNLVAGQSLTFQITQDGTGSRTLAFGTAFNWLSGAAPLLNSAAGAKTTLSCFADTTSTLQCAGGAPLTTVTTGSNCSSSAAPAVCGSASGGSVAVPTGVNPTLTVNTSAVTANSQILMNIDESLGTKLSVTCNTTLTTLVNPVVTARSAGVSFTVQIGATLTVNPACVSYLVVN